MRTATLQQRFPAESHALCILTTIERGLSTSYEAKLAQMGYTIEPVELNTGRFMQAVRTGNLIYTSGQVSSWVTRRRSANWAKTSPWNKAMPRQIVRAGLPAPSNR